VNGPEHQQRVAALRAAIEHSGLERSGWEHPCAYLPGRTARDVAFQIEGLEPGLYHALMDLNFRRSGAIVYRPACRGCDQCRAIRVPAAEFRPNRAQRRCLARHRGLEIEVGPPRLTDEKHALYQRYLRVRHDGKMDDALESLRGFLYESPLDTREVVYRRDGRIVAVGIFDREPAALSTVYCYFAPEASRDSLGVYNVLWTIEQARTAGIPYVYLGYYVRDCPKMNYKINYRPCELLTPDGTWRRTDRAAHGHGPPSAAGPARPSAD
jgi:arginine-tRNA-protein transferase